MNNVALGSTAGGAAVRLLRDDRRRRRRRARRGRARRRVHTHMTNTMNTPIEALEAYYPLRVRRYALRPARAAAAAIRAATGVVREIEFLTDAEVTLLGERRRVPPYGLAGGGPGARGTRLAGAAAAAARGCPAKTMLRVRARRSAVRRDAGRRRVRRRPASRATGQAAWCFVTRSSRRSSSCTPALQIGRRPARWRARCGTTASSAKPARRSTTSVRTRSLLGLELLDGLGGALAGVAQNVERTAVRRARSRPCEAGSTSFRPSVWTRFTEARTSSSDRRAARVSAIETTPP